MTLFNLNLIGRVGLGTERAFSPLILFCCLVLLLVGALSIPWQRALGMPGLFLLAALATYLFIGSLVGFATGLNSQPEKDFWHFLSGYLKSIVIIVAAAFGSCMVLRHTGSERLLVAILLIMSVNCFLILASPLVLEDANRLSGTLGDPNHAGFYGCMTAGLALSLLSFNLYGKMSYLALSLSTAVTVGTFSRAAILILVLLFLWFMLRSVRIRKAMMKWGVVLALMGLVAGMATDSRSVILDEDQLRRLKSMSLFGIEGRYDSSFQQRLFLMGLALDEVVKSPVLGSGLGNLQRLDGAPLSKIGQILGAHNQYLVFVGEAGIIPLTLFLAFLGCNWKRSRAMTSPAKATVVAWNLAIALFLLTSHAMFLLRFSNFLVGLSCAMLAHEIRRKPAR